MPTLKDAISPEAMEALIKQAGFAMGGPFEPSGEFIIPKKTYSSKAFSEAFKLPNDAGKGDEPTITQASYHTSITIMPTPGLEDLSSQIKKITAEMNRCVFGTGVVSFGKPILPEPPTNPMEEHPLYGTF